MEISEMAPLEVPEVEDDWDKVRTSHQSTHQTCMRQQSDPTHEEVSRNMGLTCWHLNSSLTLSPKAINTYKPEGCSDTAKGTSSKNLTISEDLSWKFHSRREPSMLTVATCRTGIGDHRMFLSFAAPGNQGSFRLSLWYSTRNLPSFARVHQAQ